MINETLKRIEETVRSAEAIDAGKKQELLSLVADLKTEVSALADTHEDHAQSIAGFTQISTHEATRPDRDEELLQYGLGGLAASVREFEASHPRLVGVVNSLHQVLANVGLG